MGKPVKILSDFLVNSEPEEPPSGTRKLISKCIYFSTPKSRKLKLWLSDYTVFNIPVGNLHLFSRIADNSYSIFESLKI